MKKFPKVVVSTMLLAGAAMLPAIAQQTSSERADLARYQKYAGAPVDSVRYFQINGFEYLAPDKVAIWFGVNKLYLLTVDTPCNNLAFAKGIGLTSKNNLLYKCGWSPFDGQRFHSRVLNTWVNGALAYADGQVDRGVRGQRLRFDR